MCVQASIDSIAAEMERQRSVATGNKASKQENGDRKDSSQEKNEEEEKETKNETSVDKNEGGQEREGGGEGGGEGGEAKQPASREGDGESDKTADKEEEKKMEKKMEDKEGTSPEKTVPPSTRHPPPHPIHNGYPGNEADMYHYPPHSHMYPMPPGYGMQPHPRARPPPTHQGHPSNQTPTGNIASGQGAHNNEKGYPHGYGMPPRAMFPHGYGQEMGIPPPHGWPADNEQGFPPGYNPWYHQHGYPSPPPPADMTDQRERWRVTEMMQHQHSQV